jgi:glycosyltransferase involved in cell wall biosynthesis
VTIREAARAGRINVRRLGRGLVVRGQAELDFRRRRDGRADLAVFHEFAPPPAGGGHQFLRALLGELASRGLVLEENQISARTTTCLYNSFNFEATRLRRFARADVRMIHRIDGPVGAYRGFDDGTDALVMRLNALADATILQSVFSLDKHRELGLEPRNPIVIPNAPDPGIFFPPSSRPSLGDRKVRVIAASWSSNARKGADTLVALDRTLDTDRYELTFVGNLPVSLTRSRVLQPLPSAAFADELRAHDVYLAASRDDPCSNALLEALACGLPAVFLRSGGHPELVGEGGLGFDADEELPTVLDRLVAELDQRRAAIRLSPLAEVADRYLEAIHG